MRGAKYRAYCAADQTEGWALRQLEIQAGRG